MARGTQKTPQDKLAVGHHAGEHIWGYEVHADGSISLAPTTADSMRAIIDREQGLLEMQEAIAAYVAKCLAVCSEQRRSWWHRFEKEFGDGFLDQRWAFNAFAGAISPAPEEQAAPAPQGDRP